MDSKNTKYIVLTIILLILSGFGVFFIFQINNSPLDLSSSQSETTQITQIPTSIPTQIPTITVTPTATSTAIKSNLLKISDVQMTFPENWKIASVSGNSAKILTDYKQYQVYLTLSLEKNTTNAKNNYSTESKANIIKTQYAEVYSVPSGGGAGMTGALLNNNKYLFKWDIESNQPVPKDLDQVWVPDNNITSETLLNITKTVQSSKTVTATITPTAKITPTIKITPIPTVTSTSSFLNFKNNDSGFSIDYSSSRKLYQDTESTGKRYTFYSSAGNFAVHVTPSGTWSWTNPDRNFSSTMIVSGQNTSVYEITTQTIVDLQSSTKNYTIQCVHNGKATLKTECETFIQSFKLL